jgi:hypothetical protein
MVTYKNVPTISFLANSSLQTAQSLEKESWCSLQTRFGSSSLIDSSFDSSFVIFRLQIALGCELVLFWDAVVSRLAEPSNRALTFQISGPCSFTTSCASLSSRSLTNLECRSRSAPVHSRKSICATSSGRSHTAFFIVSASSSRPNLDG